MILGSFLLLVLAVSSSQAGPLPTQDLVDEIDAKLIDPSGHEDSSPYLPRDESKSYSFLFNSPLEWLNNLDLVSYGSNGFYVTTPQKTTKNVYFNSSSTVFPLAFTLAGAAMTAYVGAYLLSFLPTGSTAQAYGAELTGYDDQGYELERDLYDLGEYDYQYPDSLDDWKYPSSDLSYGASKRKRIKSDRLGQGVGERRRFRRRRRPVRRQESGLFDNIAHFLLGPIERMGTAVVDPNTFFSQFVKSYDDYWSRRRGDTSWKTRRKSQYAQYRTAEDAEIELPLTEKVDEVFQQAQEEEKQSEDWWARRTGIVGDSEYSD